MKFAREFKERLLKDGFPAHWVETAISYGQLKKCIKRVQRELSSLGLDVDTLQQLLKSVEEQHAREQLVNEENIAKQLEDVKDRPFQYLFQASQDRGHIKPKLLFVVDVETGEPLDAKLAPETKNFFHQLAICEKLTDVRIVDEEDTDHSSVSSAAESDKAEEYSTELHSTELRRDSQGRLYKLIEVPLTSDSEFFGVLEQELSGLAHLQEEEQKKLTHDIETVGTQLSKTTKPDNSKSRKDLAHWRRLFELYLESNIFFGTHELDHGTNSGTKAEERWNKFLQQAKAAGLLERFKRAENAVALEQFLSINFELLQCVKFQEINQQAMFKILKKFDKRTALGAKVMFPSHLQAQLMSGNFSKALAAEVSNNILSVVPQLDDYLCPICFMLAYRPIRLRCQHIFCIRCLIVMQREGQKNCALCREPTVMQADSENLDMELQKFLKKYFREEAKAKQKANEKALQEDAAKGLGFANSECSVM